MQIDTIIPRTHWNSAKSSTGWERARIATCW